MTFDKTEICKTEQIENAKKLIGVIMSAPEEKQPLLMAIATAYIDGYEAGGKVSEGTLVKSS